MQMLFYFSKEFYYKQNRKCFQQLQNLFSSRRNSNFDCTSVPTMVPSNSEVESANED